MPRRDPAAPQIIEKDPVQQLSERESWPRKSGQDDRWSFCLTAGHAVPAEIRRYDKQTSPPESHTGIQGEGGVGRHWGPEHGG